MTYPTIVSYSRNKASTPICEILVLKNNDKGLFFEKDAIELALKANNDGAGYAVFKKEKGKYDVIEYKHFEIKKPVYKGIPTTAKATTIYTDFEWNHQDSQVILTNNWGAELVMNYPKNVGISPLNDFIAQKTALEAWLKKTKILHNFNQCGEFDETLYNHNQTLLPIANKTDQKEIVTELFERQFLLEENEFIIMHFRLATIGKTAHNIQPIIENDFITIHNGVFTALGNHESSDTREFTQNLQTLYNLAHLKTKKEERKFIETFISFTQGYYSAFIYSIKTKQLYYFKNGANFFTYADNTMYSTREERFPQETYPTSEFI